MAGVTQSNPQTAVEHVSASGTGSPIVDHFSLIQGGPIFRFQTVIHMAMPDRPGVVKRALLTILITWFPLLILSLVQGGAFGTHVRIPFLYDFAAAARFLIGLPLLVIAEAVIDPRLNYAVKHFVKSGLVDSATLPSFEDAILKTNKLRDHIIPTLVILVFAFLPLIWFKEPQAVKSGISTWRTISSPSGESLSLAGWWFALVSVSLFRILLFRWIWITILWTSFLRRITHIDLGCVATHPDKAGGLGFLADEELYFGVIAFAASVVVAGAFGNLILYQGATVSSLKFLMIASCVLDVILFAAPLLVLTPKLIEVKHRGTYEYGELGTGYSRAFEAKWMQGHTPQSEPLLGTADIQSLADLSNSFSVVEEMKVVLIDRKLLIGLAVFAILPLVPLIIIATPADKLARAVLKLLF